MLHVIVLTVLNLLASKVELSGHLLLLLQHLNLVYLLLLFLVNTHLVRELRLTDHVDTLAKILFDQRAVNVLCDQSTLLHHVLHA